MTKLTTERLETIATWREKYGNSANVMIPAEEAELMARQILAYEQAARNPVAWNHTKLSKGCGMTTPLYAAPVLPKQPELIGMKVSIDTGSDNIGHRLFGEIVGTIDSNGVPVLCIEVTENNGDMAAPAQPVSEPYKLPSGWKLVPIEPTAAMFHAFNDCDYGRKSMRERYIQMIEAAPAHTLSEHSAAIKDVITERQRQVSEEGWTPANPRRDLVKAGALILAEIERMDRTSPAQESE